MIQSFRDAHAKGGSSLREASASTSTAIGILLICTTALFAQSGGQQVDFVIQPGDWALGAGSGLVPLPDGTMAVGAGYGSSFSRDLGISPAQIQTLPVGGCCTKGIYQMNFSVVNGEPGYPGYYTAEVYFGTQELCEASGWGMGAFLWNGAYGSFYRNSFTCHSPAYLIWAKSLPGGGTAQGQSNLFVKFTVNDGSFNGGWPLVFKDVSLTFTPTN